ncbi:uncharacterized protein LOC109866041 [Oncorhynchus kisutch]|uniref:uncharacterized protein LOC109866041 n=1 Tax=Oncorhynchus kisutch TaxID=8019 RepID=UPI0012DC416A|nr:uncharacterized protein LOC109866041 [Oncorhynchus kisutch]
MSSSSSSGIGGSVMGSEAGAVGPHWEDESTSSESKSSYRPAWRPRREALNIDCIFTCQRGSPLGYSTLPGPPLPSEFQQHCPTNTADLQGARERAGGVGGVGGDTEGVAGMPGLLGNDADCPPPPPLRGAESQPRLIQRMESGYESSPDREVGQKRVLMSGPSWRTVPKSKSTSAILQELPAPLWGCNNSLGAGHSELDELQEEVVRRARQQEQQRRKESEREAAVGFNPRPSKYMDLDQLQQQAVLSPLHEANSRSGLTVAACMGSTAEPITQEQDMEQETGSASPQGHRSEQSGPLQVLLMPNQEGEEVRPAYQDATLGPGQPPLHSSLPPPSTINPPAQVEEGEKGEQVRRGEGGQGMSLEELQAGGVRPVGRHLAISLPSLSLRLWDMSHTHAPPSHTHSYSDPQYTHPPSSHTNPEHPHTHSDRPPTPCSSRSQPHPSPSTASPHWSDQGSAANTFTRHWSSWSVDRPDAVVTPYDTPPDRRLPFRPHLPYRNYNSQPAPGLHDACDPEEAEFSELDFLYRASLQAGCRGGSPVRRLQCGVGGPARSLTPNANMERSVYQTDCSSTMVHSLSGTIINPRRHRLAATRSFEMSNGAGSFWCLTGVKLSSDH